MQENTRYISRVVKVGKLPLGGGYPVRIQSMTNTPTLDTEATVCQVIRLAQAGCELVRITARDVREAKHLAVIKKTLRDKGCEVPLVADIHFQPKAAEVAAAIVEKVRINPGNYIRLKQDEYKKSGPETCDEENEIIAGKLAPLLKICTDHGTVIRIGINHGSLSERIRYRFGDGPAGMVESALEYARICDHFGFHDLVFSMKSSNIGVMIRATRMLAVRLRKEGMNHPLHLGVTEAGNEESGIIKSAAGTGTLLLEGIGDTVRVSLTGDPLTEIPVARCLVSLYGRSRSGAANIKIAEDPVFRAGPAKTFLSPGQSLSGLSRLDPLIRPDYIYFEENLEGKKIRKIAKPDFSSGIRFAEIFALKSPVKDSFLSSENSFLMLEPEDIPGCLPDIPESGIQGLVICLNGQEPAGVKKFLEQFRNHFTGIKIIIRKRYSHDEKGEWKIAAAAEMSYFLTDGLADGIWLETPGAGDGDICRISMSILQVNGLRTFSAEYIACPSCGRTEFNLSETLERIRDRTSHLAGLKLGIMGCIVNGPGEMAGSDYGYVGSGPGMVTLYKRNEIVRKNISEKDALEAFIEVIKENGDWKEKI